MADELKTKTKITDREIMKGYARNVTLADREKEVDEKLKAFAEGSQSINRALSKTVQVPAPTKEDRNNTKGERRTLTQQLRTANREYMNAQPEKRAEKRQAMYSLLGNALSRKGEVPTKNDAGEEVKGVEADSPEIIAYGAALAKHLKGEYPGNLEALKTDASDPAVNVDPGVGVGDAAAKAAKARYEANKRYLKQLNDTKELAKSIAATEAIVDSRELRLAAIRALDFLQDDALSNSGISLADLAGGVDARNIAGVGLNQIGETVKGGWWNPGKDGDSGSYGFDADLGAAGATKLIAALINNKGMGKGADLGGIVFTNGTQDARRGAFRTAFALGVEFEFEDTQAYKEFVPGDPRPRECHILAMKFQEKARQVRRENNGVIDHGRVYAELFADTEATGFSMANGTFDKNARSAALVRREFWLALVHTKAGWTGASLYSKLRKSISSDQTTGRAMAIAMKGIHAKLKEQFPAANQKADFDKAFTAIIDDASKTIGPENFVNIVFSVGINRKKSNTEFLGKDARKDIAKYFMTKHWKYSAYTIGPPSAQESRVKEKIASSLFEEEIQEIGRELQSEFDAADAAGTPQAEKNLVMYLKSFDHTKRSSMRVDKSKLEPVEFKEFKLANANLTDPERARLRAKFMGKNPTMIPSVLVGDAKNTACDEHLARMTKAQIEELCKVDGEKVAGADGALDLTPYGFDDDVDRIVLRDAYKAVDPDTRGALANDDVDRDLRAMTTADFKALANNASMISADKLNGADMTKFSTFEKEALLAQRRNEPEHARDTLASLDKLTVAELRTLCDATNSVPFNPKEAALDAMIDKALARKVAEIAAYPAKPTPEQVAAVTPAEVAALSAQDRAAALQPLVTIVAKQAIAGNAVTNRTTSKSWKQVGKQAAAGAGLGLVGLLAGVELLLVGAALSPVIAVMACFSGGRQTLRSEAKGLREDLNSMAKPLTDVLTEANAHRAQETEIAELVQHIAERGREGVDNAAFKTAFVGGDIANPGGPRVNGLKERILAAGIGRPVGGNMPSASSAGKLVAVIEAEILRPGAARNANP